MAEDNGYPYTTVPNKLRDFQSKLPGIGKPQNATQSWLKGLGYKTGNDMTILAVARRVGIIASGGEPTEYWDAIRRKDSSNVAEHVRTAYRELFALYPNADKQDDEAIRNFFPLEHGRRGKGSAIYGPIVPGALRTGRLRVGPTNDTDRSEAGEGEERRR